MKYVWIVMLIIIYVIYLIAVVADVYDELKHGLFKFPDCLLFLEWYSYIFGIGHVLALFFYSLYIWRSTL